ncbi:MAG: bifunctional metallophosphatase/5'-nucleotidase [Anaerolineaceae bacterium]|nr:bifunctional metallophosphatase/5'-nucleotidase [Anaerolineaceae bacterium]
MKNSKNAVCFAFIIFLVSIACVMPVFGEGEATKTNDNDEVAAVVLFTNDIHCAYEENIGFDGLALYKKQLEQVYDHVFLVDSGDAVQGSAIGVISKGQAITRMMNAVGYDVATLGNHEFDFGMEALDDIVELFEGTYVCVNFCTSDGTPIFSPGIILDAGEMQIGFVGADTPDTYTKTSIRNILDDSGQPMYDFLVDRDGSKLRGALQDNVNKLRREGADVVILLSHLGDNEAVSEQFQLSNIMEGVNGIDAIFDGHTHQFFSKTIKDKEGKEVIALQTGTKFESVGQLTIYKDGHMDAKLVEEIPGSDSLPMETVVRRGKERFIDPEMHAIQTEIVQSYSDILNEKIGETSFDMLVEEDGSYTISRGQENALCELVADAYREAGKSDIGFAAAGSLRNNILKGDITYSNLLSLIPYTNEIQTISVSGQMLKDILEYSVSDLPLSSAKFPQVSGLTFTIDMSIESSVRLDDKGLFTYVDGPYRVSDIQVDGKDLDLSAEYTLTTTDYIINGGDGFSTFRESDFVNDTMKVDNIVVKEYIVNVLGGVIPDIYREPLGRINVVNP